MKQVATIPVHSSGYGNLNIIHSESVLVTSGEDGKIRLTNPKTSERTGQIQMDDMVSALAVTPDEKHILASCLDDNTVYQYSYPDCQMEKMILRSTVQIFHIAVSTHYVAVASEDPVTRVLNIEGDQHVSAEIKLKGQEGSVNSAAVSMDEKYIATACVSYGTVMVFSLPEGKEEWSTDAVDSEHRYNDDMFCRLAWDPTGKYLAIPGRKEIELREYGTFRLIERLHDAAAGHTSPVNIVSWSPNGLYLASSCLGKEVHIWDVGRRECIERYQFDYVLTGIEWSKTENALAILNQGGACAYVSPVIPERMTGPCGMPLVPAAADGVQEPATTVDAPTMNYDHDDQQNNNTISVKAIKSQYGFREDGDFDLLDEEDEDEKSMTGENDLSSRAGPVAAAVIRETDRQAAFQPGSAEDGGTTILAWTATGEIQSIPSDEFNLVKIEFANKSRRTIKFHDQYFFTMAALSESGAAFGVKASQDEDQDEDLSMDDASPSVVFYRAFDAWSSRVTWSVSLPRSENVMAVATGADWVAAATSTNLVRLYNAASGTVKCILHAPGRVVAMTGHAEFLAVAYHLPAGEKMLEDCQPIGYTLYCVSSTVLQMASGRVPLSPSNTTLSWMGFSDASMLFVADSRGLVQALHMAMGWQWSPAVIKANVKAISNPLECCRLWCVGIVRDQLLYFALPAGKYVPTLRGKKLPVPSTLSLKTAAMCNGETSFSYDEKRLQHERHLLLFQHECRRKQKALQQVSLSREFVAPQAALDKEILQLMKKACAEEKPETALDLARALSLEKSFSIAIKVASHFNEHELSNRLTELQETRFEYEEDDLDDALQDAINEHQDAAASRKYFPPQPKTRSNIYTIDRTTRDVLSQEQQQSSQMSSMSLDENENENKQPADGGQQRQHSNQMVNPFANKKKTGESKRKNVNEILEAMKSPVKAQRF